MPVSKLEERISQKRNENVKAGMPVLGSELDKKIKAALAAGKIKKGEIPSIVAAYVRKLEGEAQQRRAKLAEMTQARQEAMGDSRSLSALRPLTAGMMNFADQATFGAAPVIGGALAGAIRPDMTMGEGIEDARLQLEALSQPTAGAKLGSAAGMIAGSFVGPRAAVGRGSDIVASLPFVGRAVQSSRLGRGIFEIGKAATAAGAGVAASELIEGGIAGREAEQIMDRIQTGLMVAAPIAVGAGTLAASFRVKPSDIDEAGIRLLNRMRRVMPGFRPTPDFLRQGSETQGVLRSLANVPGGRKMIGDYVSESIYRPMRETLEEMQRAVGPAQGAQKAGRALADIIPPEGNRSFANLRRGMMGQVFRSEGGTPVTRDSWTSIMRALGDQNSKARKALGTEGARGRPMGDALGILRSVNRKMQAEWRAAEAAGRDPRINITVQHLENLRQQFGKIAGFDAAARASRELGSVSDRDVRDARAMYHAIRNVMRQTSTSVDNAYNEARILREAQKELEPLVGAARNFDPDRLVSQVFNTKSPIRQLRLLRQRMSGVEDQALKGAYLADFLEDVSRDTTGKGARILTQTMRNKFNGNGRFRASLFDEVMGGPKNRRELNALAEVLDRVSPTYKEGSPTAGRVLDALAARQVVNLPNLAVSVMTDPKFGWGLFRQTLGAVGAYTMLNRILRGGIGRNLEQLATGGIPRNVIPVTFSSGLSTLANQNLPQPMGDQFAFPEGDTE